MSQHATSLTMRHLSVEEIQAYQRDGVILVKNILSDSQIQAGRAAIDAAVQNPGPQAEFLLEASTWDSVKDSFEGTVENTTSNDISTNNAPTPPWTMFQDQFASKLCPEMMNFIRQSPAPQLASQILSATVPPVSDSPDSETPPPSSTAILFYDHIIVKEPTLQQSSSSSYSKTDATVIPWHQDLPYWSVQGTLVSVWMCFDKMPASSAVQWILGSHQWGLYQPRHFVDASPYFGTEHMTPMPEDIDDRIACGALKVTTFDAQPGDALLFDARIIHGSPGNASGGGGSGAVHNEEGGIDAGDSATSPSSSLSLGIPHRRVAIRFARKDVIFRQYKDPKTGAITRETAIPTPDIHHSLTDGDFLGKDATNFPTLWPLPAT